MADFFDVRDEKQYMPRLSTLDRDFKILYRFEEGNVKWLADNFLERNDETCGGALSNFHKMKICLRYLCDPGYQKGVRFESLLTLIKIDPTESQ